MSEHNGPPRPADEPAGPFPESTLGQDQEPPPPAAPTQVYGVVQPPPPAAPQPESPSSSESPLWSGQPTPPPAAPTQVYGAVQPPARTPAPGMASGDPLAAAYPPGYTSPPPPGAGGPAYAPPPAGIATAPGTGALPGNYVLAGWWRRVGAQVVDGLIISAGALILMAPLGVGLFASADEGSDGGVIAFLGALILAMLIFTIVALAYAPLMMARTNGKTLGRMVVGTRVVRATGEPMTLGVAALREVVVKSLAVGIASSFTFGIAYLVDILWPLWDDENRALHDFATNTRTVLD